MSDQHGGSADLSRNVRTLEQQVQNPYTPETALVGQVPVVYDIVSTGEGMHENDRFGNAKRRIGF